MRKVMILLAIILLTVGIASASSEQQVELQTACDQLGYEIIWNGNHQPVIIRNQQEDAKLLVGSIWCEAFDGSRFYLEQAPKIKGKKIYVPAEFFLAITQEHESHRGESGLVFPLSLQENQFFIGQKLQVSFDEEENEQWIMHVPKGIELIDEQVQEIDPAKRTFIFVAEEPREYEIKFSRINRQEPETYIETIQYSLVAKEKRLP